MRAGWYEHNGEARAVLKVGEVDKPVPGEGEVLVRVIASGVNPSDVKSRRGWQLSAPRVVPHSDGAGIIEAVGAGADRGRIGERVWIWNGQWKRAFGTAAEYIALPEAQAMRLPDNTGFEAGACFGIPGLTAIHAVRLLGDIGGRTVLVTGAASGVGHYAVQMAKLNGARVIGTASVERQSHARSAGADFVIDYKNKDVAQVVKELTKGAGVNAIIDMDLSSTARLVAEGVLAPHGKHVCYGANKTGDIPLSFSAMLRGSLTLQFFLVYELAEAERKAAITALTRLVEKGSLKHTIGARYPLGEIALAHEAVEGGRVIGNVVLDI